MRSIAAAIGTARTPPTSPRSDVPSSAATIVTKPGLPEFGA